MNLIEINCLLEILWSPNRIMYGTIILSASYVVTSKTIKVLNSEHTFTGHQFIVICEWTNTMPAVTKHSQVHIFMCW